MKSTKRKRHPRPTKTATDPEPNTDFQRCLLEEIRQLRFAVERLVPNRAEKSLLRKTEWAKIAHKEKISTLRAGLSKSEKLIILTLTERRGKILTQGALGEASGLGESTLGVYLPKLRDAGITHKVHGGGEDLTPLGLEIAGACGFQGESGVALG